MMDYPTPEEISMQQYQEMLRRMRDAATEFSLIVPILNEHFRKFGYLFAQDDHSWRIGYIDDDDTWHGEVHHTSTLAEALRWVLARLDI